MKYLITAFAVALTLNVFAQSHVVGIEAGFTNMTVNGRSAWSGCNSHKAMGFGLIYEYHFKDHFQMASGVSYYEKGVEDQISVMKANGDLIINDATIVNSYNYLSIPVKAGYRFGNKIIGFANIGLMPSVLLHAEVIEPRAGEPFSEKTYNITNKVSKFDLSGIVEMGVDYQIYRKLFIAATISYQQGITSITNEDYFNESTIRHHGTAFLFGIKYNLKD